MNPQSTRRRRTWIVKVLTAFFLINQFLGYSGTLTNDADIDPVLFSLTADRSSVVPGEEFEIIIDCKMRGNWDDRLFSTALDTDFRLKLVFPEGFVQTGGDYHDFIGEKLSGQRNHIVYRVKGKFLEVPKSGTFLLLRGTRHSIEIGKFLARSQLTVLVRSPLSMLAGNSARVSAFSQCLESESMNSANGPITSDPNASNGQTRGAENQYNHYVDYTLSNVPAGGNYQVTLRYYSSSSPVVNVLVNGGSSQTKTLANSNSWNISYTESTFNVNLNAGSNILRITGTGGGSCRQDRICVTGNVSPCSIPPAPAISKTSGTTACAATNQTVTLTASGITGTVTWFRDGAQIGTGSTITKSDAGSYTATCTQDGCTSANSPAIIISQTANCGAAFSQCLEAESMNSATGPISSDPNASNGQTRGAENQYNHYVDYVLTNVPSAGGYQVKLRYYSSSAPIVFITVNGGSAQTVTLANSGSWNIGHTEHTFTVNLIAGNNTIRIAGSGGGSCRQDRVCVTGNSSPCIIPAAPAISKTSGTTVCPATNQTVTLTATGITGTVTWFRDGTQVGTGTSIAKSDAGSYTAKCSQDGCVSTASSAIVVSQTAGCGTGFSQCLEAESMTGATGPVSSDPNASNGQTRGAENQYNHYVDYVLANVPANGSYQVKLRYYSSIAPIVNVTVNGGNLQTLTLTNSGSWNIGHTEYAFTVNLTAGSNTIRVSGAGGGSCRQDRICVTGGAGPCVNPPAPTISKTSGSTVCPATNQTITLTASGFSGTITWFKDGVQIASGANHTTAVAGTYSATCTADGCVSGASNTVSVSQTAGCSGNNTLTPKMSSTGFPEVLT